MMSTKLTVTIIGAALVLGSLIVNLSAHHAFSAEFDPNKYVEFYGTVTKVEWVNPHAWFHLDVKLEDGSTENWAFEAGTPNSLFRRGFRKDSLPPGTEVYVDGYGAKDGSNRANGRDMRFADGSKLFLGSSGTGSPPRELTPDHERVD